MQTLNSYKWFILVMLLALGLFYWYGWRPSEIRKECSQRAVISAQRSFKQKAQEGFVSKEEAEKGYIAPQDFEFSYQECLREHGLAKQALLCVAYVTFGCVL